VALGNNGPGRDIASFQTRGAVSKTTVLIRNILAKSKTTRGLNAAKRNRALTCGNPRREAGGGYVLADMLCQFRVEPPTGPGRLVIVFGGVSLGER
jgi:hypothetical protein